MIPVQDRRLLMFFEPSRNARPRNACNYCNKPTHEGKSECVEHLHKRPYIAALLKRMEQQEKDGVKIEHQGTRAVKLDGPHVSEIVGVLKLQGPKSVEELSRSTHFSRVVVSACLRKMELATLVKMLKNSHGSTMACLTKDAYELANI